MKSTQEITQEVRELGQWIPGLRQQVGHVVIGSACIFLPISLFYFEHKSKQNFRRYYAWAELFKLQHYEEIVRKVREAMNEAKDYLESISPDVAEILDIIPTVVPDKE